MLSVHFIYVHPTSYIFMFITLSKSSYLCFVPVITCLTSNVLQVKTMGLF